MGQAVFQSVVYPAARKVESASNAAEKHSQIVASSAIHFPLI